MRRTLAAACALAIALAVVTVPTYAASLRPAGKLCVGGKKCYETIQAAVDAASDGDTIRIGRGTFAGGVTVGKSVDLVGDGAGKTIIQGGGPVLTLGTEGAPAQPTISIRGLTITGGLNRTKPDPAFVNGGGVYIPAAVGPDGPFPGAIVTITSSVIEDNRVEPSATVNLCPEPQQCPWASASGAGIESQGSLTLVDTTVRNNHSVTDTGLAEGGGIRVLFGSLTLGHSVVSGNESVATPPFGYWPQAGGIIVDGGTGAIAISDSEISNNATSLTSTGNSGAYASGTALDFDESHVGPVTITNTRITDNSITATSPIHHDLGVGDLVYINAGSPLTMRDSIVAGNRITATGASVGFGGAIFEVHSPTTITNTRIVGNETSITSLAGDANGYATFVAWSSDPVVLRDSVISGNSVQVSTTGGSATLQGAGIWNAGTLQLLDTKVQNNVGRASGPSGTAQGGGIWNGLYPDGPLPVSLTLTDSKVAGNSVSGSAGLTVQGGGLFTAFPVTLQHSKIEKNKPDQCFGC